MSAHKFWIVGGLVAVAVAVAVYGIVLADLPRVAQVCAGDVVSTDLCEPARLGQSIFGSILVGSSIISLAIITGFSLLKVRHPKKTNFAS